MKYWLVQRLAQAYPNNGKTGFDSQFDLEYMGSAEYEFRTPYESLQRMRKADGLIVFHHELHSCGGKALDEPAAVFYVASKHGILDKITEHAAWVDDPRCKEQTYFPENLTGIDWSGKPIDGYYNRTVAWWSFTDDIAWTLDPNVAQALALAFQPELGSAA